MANIGKCCSFGNFEDVFIILAKNKISLDFKRFPLNPKPLLPTIDYSKVARAATKEVVPRPRVADPWQQVAPSLVKLIPIFTTCFDKTIEFFLEYLPKWWKQKEMIRAVFTIVRVCWAELITTDISRDFGH